MFISTAVRSFQIKAPFISIPMRSASSASMINAASASNFLSLFAMPRSTYCSPLSIPPPFSLLQLFVFSLRFLFLLLKFCSMSYLISTLSISLIIVINDHIQAVLNIEVKWFQIAIWLMIIRYHLTLSMMLLIDYIIISSVCLFSAFFRY